MTELAHYVRLLIRAVVLQQVEIHALEASLASNGIVLFPAMGDNRRTQMELAQPILELISSDHPAAIAQAMKKLFPNG